MFRYATISSISCCRNLSTNTARNHILKSKPQLMKSSFNYLLLARCESTGTGTFNASAASASATDASTNTNLSTNYEAATATATTTSTKSTLGEQIEALDLSSSSPVLSSINSSSPSETGIEIGSVPSSSFSTTTTDLSSETIVDPAASIVQTINDSDQLNFIPAAPEIPLDAPIQEIAKVLAANGEPALKSLGLGSNWPPGLVQQGLEFLHCDLGMPWWTAIVAGTIVIRLLLFPLVIKSQRTAAKMHNNMPQMQVIQMKMTEARQSGNQLMAAKYSNDMMVFMKEKEMNPVKQMLVPLAQAPIFVSVFMGLRGMANLPVESMKTGGALWFTDLTIADPYYALPLITCATLFVTLEIGAEGARMPSAAGGNLMKYVLRAIPIVVFPFTMNFPAALLCYWVTTNTVSLGQVLLLRIPRVRERLNIEKLRKHDPENLPVTNKGFKQSFKDSWTNMKITREMEERERYDDAIFKRAGRAPITKTYRYDPTKVKVPPTIQAKTKSS